MQLTQGLYGATAFGYANDSDFIDVSTSEKYWQKVIDEYYDKYEGIRQWHSRLIDTAKRELRLTIPSGRYYPIQPEMTRWGLKWPETVCKNYPVQGFGADLVMLARLEAKKRLRESGLEVLLVGTIHDSIVADTPEKNVIAVGKILNDSVEAVPHICRQVFGYEFSLPLTAEVQAGYCKKGRFEKIDGELVEVCPLGMEELTFD